MVGSIINVRKHTAATLLTGAAPNMPANSLVTKILVGFWLTAVPILKAPRPIMAGKRLTLFIMVSRLKLISDLDKHTSCHTVLKSAPISTVPK
jgi:hypothetical protein